MLFAAYSLAVMFTAGRVVRGTDSSLFILVAEARGDGMEVDCDVGKRQGDIHASHPPVQALPKGGCSASFVLGARGIFMRRLAAR